MAHGGGGRQACLLGAPLCADNSVEIAQRAAEQAFEVCPGITGVTTWSDSFAAGMLHLSQHQLRVPEDVEVIGFDDTLAPA